MTEIIQSIKINIGNSGFEISGSSDFIDKHLENLEEIVSKNHDNNNIQTEISTTQPGRNNEKNASNDDTLQDIYARSGLYHLEDTGEVAITCKVPGRTNAEKMVNVTLICLHAKNGKLSANMLKNTCKKHSCLDAHNFAAVLKRSPNNFICDDTKNRDWGVELTFNGKEAAKQLLEGILNAR